MDAPEAKSAFPRSPALDFAQFVPLPENLAARAAVRCVAACLGARRRRRVHNPLYLHGPAGTGKTHLVSALVEEATRRVPDLIVTMLSAGAFAEPTDGTPSAARPGDLFVVEDVQYLPARAAERFGWLLDDLLARQVQMIFTATTSPRGLDLPARLSSRLASGLVVGLEPLPASSRLALLEAKARQRQLTVHQDVLAWLAEHLTGGRQLEGALTQLETLARMNGRPLDAATVAGHFREQAEAGRPTVERIMRRVGGHFRVERRALRSARRGRDVLLPRQVGMYLARQLTGLSLAQI